MPARISTLANSGEAGGGDVEETDLGTVPEDEEVLLARRPPLRGQSCFSFMSASLLMFSSAIKPQRCSAIPKTTNP